MLRHKLSAFGLSCGYVDWFPSYLFNRQYQAIVFGILSSPFEVLSGVLQGYVLEPLLFTVCVNDLYDEINHSRDLLLLAISKFTVLLTLLKIAACCSLILYKFDALITVLNSQFVKLKLHSSQET
jgi:hypothetical protein